jgi:short-subunit dehydrogenase
MAHALAPQMAQRGEGHLLFMSSLSGKAATAGSSIYNATKFGLRGFASALRAELRGSGVGVSAVFPGFIREAGMFAESGAKLPPGVGTRSPQDVADAVVTAIERNRGEVDVAPLTLRLGSTFSGVAPEVAATFTRLMGGAKITASVADGQREKR